ncbi:MAG: hypothetical protein AB1Y25_06560 [Cycloclasticus sp.]
MITSLNPQSNLIPYAAQNTALEKTVSSNPQSSEASKSTPRQNVLDFMQTASPEALESRLELIKKSAPSLIMVNLKEMIANGNSFEVAGRINRLNESFRAEAANVHQQEVDLINQGQANGQSAKTILNDIINFRDQQSELFKVSTGWEGSLWSDADNYSALVARSSDYINAFA